MRPESPKTRFLKTPVANTHADLAASPAVIVAFDTALLQMQYDLGNARDAMEASSIQFRMEGARRLRDTFLTLADKPQSMPLNRGDNLPNPHA